jgi:hypothetical protein
MGFTKLKIIEFSEQGQKKSEASDKEFRIPKKLIPDQEVKKHRMPDPQNSREEQVQIHPFPSTLYAASSR